jgi:hypothetical protein
MGGSEKLKFGERPHEHQVEVEPTERGDYRAIIRDYRAV